MGAVLHGLDLKIREFKLLSFKLRQLGSLLESRAEIVSRCHYPPYDYQYLVILCLLRKMIVR
jgi:hypothetical protein